MKEPEALSIEELSTMQQIQLDGYTLQLRNEAFTRRLAEAHGLDLAGCNKTWAVQGTVIVHTKDAVTGAELSQNASA